MTPRLILAAIVFGIDVWALSRLFAMPMRTRKRAGWILMIVALPAVGAWLWWIRCGRRSRLST